MADTLNIHQFVAQLWDGELGYLDELITRELRRRALWLVRGDGVPQERHVALATAHVVEMVAE